MRAENSDPLREVTFQPDSASRVEYGKKRVGKPSLNWIHQTKKYVYVGKQHMFSYDESVSQDKQLLQWARERRF